MLEADIKYHLTVWIWHYQVVCTCLRSTIQVTFSQSSTCAQSAHNSQASPSYTSWHQLYLCIHTADYCSDSPIGSTPANLGIRAGRPIHLWLAVDGEVALLVELTQLGLDGARLLVEALHLTPGQHSKVTCTQEI